jgi:nucleotidyltransferase/DNA polymerase involved in DNA repair
MSGVRTLVVWCPDWPVVARGLCDRPAAVLCAGVVDACSVAARAEGVVRGLRRRQAEARCPGLVVVEHDPAAEARAFEPVVAAIAGAVAGAVLAVGAAALLGATGLAESGVSAGGTALGVLVAVVVSALAAVATSILPTWRAASRPPIHSLTSGA